jgi:hypothetical protein
MLSQPARMALVGAFVPIVAVACAETSPSAGVVVAPVLSASPASPTPPATSATSDASASTPSTADASPLAPTAGASASTPGGADAGAAGAPARFRACAADMDCIAVPRVGCCHNGWNEAVAASQKDAYAASFVCPEAHPICAMLIVRDTRRALCDAATRLCTMTAK